MDKSFHSEYQPYLQRLLQNGAFIFGKSGLTIDQAMEAPVGMPLLEMHVSDHSYWMCKFVLEVRKKDGKEYPPKSLYALVCCLKCFFEQHGVHDINPLEKNRQC